MLEALSALQEALLAWGEEAGRDLPWRRTRDPWAVLASELMLQQTQVARIAPRYGAFLARFPTPAACAAAPLGDVVRAWAGLGYNRRAVSLHRGAVAVVEHHGGRLPDDVDALRRLPGVGPYTARAVLAFAFERDVGVVDTNAGRVLARAVAGRSLAPAEAQELADAAVPTGRSWAWNSAVLDLGATVCTKRAPRCEACPVRAFCAWRRAGAPAPDPAENTAFVSTRQATFAGSDRQLRGRLVAALRQAPVRLADVAATIGLGDAILDAKDAAAGPAREGGPLDHERAVRVARGLVADGLARLDGDVLSLP